MYKLLWSIFVLFGLKCVNMNIFNDVTYPEPIKRVTPFNASVARRTCRLKPDSGPCRANLRMHYFDPTTGECKNFTWGGCQGNGNRFDSLDECTDSCKTKAGPKSRPRWCSLTFDYGFCFGALKRYYYDRLWKVCKQTIYSGCGGNKNNFYSLEQCEYVCRLGKGRLPVTSKRMGSSRKVLIINPKNTTPKRGKNQDVKKKAKDGEDGEPGSPSGKGNPGAKSGDGNPGA